MIPDEQYYLEATREFEAGNLNEALLAKAMALEDDEQKLKKQYISLRVAQLKRNAAIVGGSHILQGLTRTFIAISTLAVWLWIIGCIGGAILMALTEGVDTQILGPIYGAVIGFGALGLIKFIKAKWVQTT